MALQNATYYFLKLTQEHNITEALIGPYTDAFMMGTTSWFWAIMFSVFLTLIYIKTESMEMSLMMIVLTVPILLVWGVLPLQAGKFIVSLFIFGVAAMLYKLSRERD